MRISGQGNKSWQFIQPYQRRARRASLTIESAGGDGATAYTPKLDFSDARNTQYLGGVM